MSTRLAAVGGFGDHREVGLVGKELAQPGTHHGVIVDDGDADHVGAGAAWRCMIPLFERARRWTSLKLIRRSPVAFPLAVLAAVAMVFISEGSYWQSVDALDELGTDGARPRQGPGPAQEHPGRRDRPAWLPADRPHRTPRSPTPRHCKPIGHLLEALDRYYGGNPNANTVLDKLTRAGHARLSLIAETIRLKQEGKSDAGQRDLAHRLRQGTDGRDPPARQPTAGTGSERRVASRDDR